MDISICILTHNQPTLLPLCVASCFEEIQRAGIGGEVIVIDNASADRYPGKLARTFPQIRILRNEQNLSFSVANNAGIRASNGKHVLIFNDDALLQAGSLGILLKVIESSPKIGAVGAKLVNPDGSPQAQYIHERAANLRVILSWLLHLNPVLIKRGWSRRAFTSNGNPGASRETELVVGACLLARRDALFGVGLFDEKFHYLFEDADLCFQLRKAGWQIFYAADALVTHYGSASLKRWSRAEFFSTLISSIVLYFRKDGKFWQFAILKIVLIPLVFCRMLFFVARDLCRSPSGKREWVSNVRGHLRVLKGLFGIGFGRRKALEVKPGTRPEPRDV